jgi:hypothetical protein
VNPLAIVHAGQEGPELPPGLRVVVLLGQLHLLFFNRPHRPRGVPVLLRAPERRHTDQQVNMRQRVDVLKASYCTLVN